MTIAIHAAAVRFPAFDKTSDKRGTDNIFWAGDRVKDFSFTFIEFFRCGIFVWVFALIIINHDKILSSLRWIVNMIFVNMRQI